MQCFSAKMLHIKRRTAISIQIQIRRKSHFYHEFTPQADVLILFKNFLFDFFLPTFFK